MESMSSCVKTKLERLGYQVHTKPYEYIEEANCWYRNELIDNFHKRTSVTGGLYEIDRMNFAKRGCADDANLCEVIDINVGDDTQNEFVHTVLENNRFDTMYRKQLERMSAAGTVAAYVRLDNAVYLSNGKAIGGEIRLTYCYAEDYIPLKIVNDEVVEAAFSSTKFEKEGKQTTLVMFTQKDDHYRADTFVFDKSGKEIAAYWIVLGDVKPFAVMQVAEVNNIRYMEGFGYPKVYGAIPVLKQIDLCHMILNGDLEKGEKFVLTNEAIVEIDKKTGKPKPRSKEWKRLFVLLGRKPIDGNGYIQEYNPKIRVDEIQKAFELCLSLFSMTFGFGSKKYIFEQNQIQTATQYIGERQDCMQELNKQREEARQYIKGIVRAILWFSNTFQNTSFDLTADICIDFDDSYIEDKNTRMENMRADAQAFSDIPEFTIRYIEERLNISREEAMKIYDGQIDENEPEVED